MRNGHNGLVQLELHKENRVGFGAKSESENDTWKSGLYTHLSSIFVEEKSQEHNLIFCLKAQLFSLTFKAFDTFKNSAEIHQHSLNLKVNFLFESIIVFKVRLESIVECLQNRLGLVVSWDSWISDPRHTAGYSKI